ncbi:MAG: saccharopine dehydrogenase NADP-binding domain-containing protein, partial [Mycobacterium sp.]|nr:saccharopine dehydrogenase NADP-binding domain-containing protein [Mycobacterium sp.]
MTSIWLLGATGRGGRAVANALTARGIPVVLLGRNSEQLAAVAASLSGPPEAVETLAIAGWVELPALIARHRPGVVVNTVGPFTRTAVPLALACLKAGTHYVDLANELDAVRELLDLDAEAHDRGVTIVTGAGFGVLATEALAIKLRGEREPAVKAQVAALPAV